MTLTVGRLRTLIRTPVPIAAARCESWYAALAAQDDAALGFGLARDDEWLLIRHLRVATQWRADEADVDVGHIWGTALRQAIESALANDADCVRYANRRAAIADMLYRSALGERARQWAWHRIGLIERAEVSSQDALEAAVALLVRAPDLIWPVLQRIVAAEDATAALSAVLRALPASAWIKLFAASPRAAPYARWVGQAVQTEPSPAAETPDAIELRASAEARKLLAWAAARPYVVERHVDTLAVLLAALVWPPHVEQGDVLRRRTGLARATLAPAKARIGEAPLIRLPPSRHTLDDAEAEIPVAPEQTRLPELPDPAQWQPTAWAGALFWLGRIAASDAFAWIGQQAELPADALRLLLRELARALGVPDDDSALAAFCGGHVPQAEAPGAITRHAEAIVAQWSNWLGEAAPELAEPRLLTVCRRGGRLRMEPGWIELHLPLANVDTSIRQLGLDLDPGWLPWLGCVLRICYDD